MAATGKEFNAIGKAAGLMNAWALVGLGLMSGVAQAQVQTSVCTAPGGFGAGAPVIPPIPLASLKTVPNPVLGPKDPKTGKPTVRGDLVDYIANLDAAIQLGKALFWDMQAGSDNKTACATCHFQAGADTRTKNQLNPGPNSAYNVGGSPNYQLTSASFPLSPASDDIAGSQGVRSATFLGINSKTGAESTSSSSGSRQVTGKNAPPVINAVFNHRQFWNGRAQTQFNGVNPWGDRDTSARVWMLNSYGSPVPIDIHIQNASLASQAVGPALNAVEMSAAGRTFPDLGRKMLLVKPLGLQKVSTTDGVLGSMADKAAGKGLKTSYSALIQKAFQPKWWSSKSVTVNGKSYSMTEANFSLYWGLSIMLYEATLVSDNSPMDQYLALVGAARPGPGDASAAVLDQVVNRFAASGVTRQGILDGLALFEQPVAPPPSFPAVTGTSGVGCIGCHLGAELTGASMRNLTGPGLEPGDTALKSAGFDLRMERMFTNLSWTPPGPLSPAPAGADTITFDPSTYAVTVTHMIGAGAVSIPLLSATYDAGWYNIGVRPTADDTGLGGLDPFGKYLSWTQYLQQTLADPAIIKVPGNSLPCAGINLTTPFPDELLNATGFPLLSGPLHKTESNDVAGSFKVPHLRNVELNGPYLNNGGKSTLMQVVAFYAGGGEFPNATKAPAMVPLRLSADQAKSLVSFMISLTDERVRFQAAPFDHPQLFVPQGDNPVGTDTLVEIPATGSGGATTPLQPFLGLNPFS